jgi:hypothetical protein
MATALHRECAHAGDSFTHPHHGLNVWCVHSIPESLAIAVWSYSFCPNATTSSHAMSALGRNQPPHSPVVIRTTPADTHTHTLAADGNDTRRSCD